ncbi:MAG TPA: FAD-binding protein, partial [Burkholderiaceae bacterium]|nr:FAD-binding protein [Burkholderiaceae bacterium]
MNRLEDLTALVGTQHVLTGAAAEVSLTDWRGRFSGQALAVVRPGNTEEVAQVVKWCLANQVPIVPQGGNTGLCGGATPDQSGSALVLSLGR